MTSVSLIMTRTIRRILPYWFRASFDYADVDDAHVLHRHMRFTCTQKPPGGSQIAPLTCFQKKRLNSGYMNPGIIILRPPLIGSRDETQSTERSDKRCARAWDGSCLLCVLSACQSSKAPRALPPYLYTESFRSDTVTSTRPTLRSGPPRLGVLQSCLRLARGCRR